MENLPEKIVISEDLDHLPPPYCYRYKIEIKPSKNDGIDARIDIEYYDRDELDPEEIEAEGFSADDNFKWQGSLPRVWKDEVAALLGNMESGSGKKGIKIALFQNGKAAEQKPKDGKKFAFFSQELIQAIYETSGKQDALILQAAYNTEKNSSEMYRLEISFLNRSATLTRNKKVTSVAWKTAQTMLNRLFRYDFDPFAAIAKNPRKKGFFVDAGEGYWYEAGVGIKSVDKNDPKDEILGLFRSL